MASSPAVTGTGVIETRTNRVGVGEGVREGSGVGVSEGIGVSVGGTGVLVGGSRWRAKGVSVGGARVGSSVGGGKGFRTVWGTKKILMKIN